MHLVLLMLLLIDFSYKKLAKSVAGLHTQVNGNLCGKKLNRKFILYLMFYELILLLINFKNLTSIQKIPP